MSLAFRHSLGIADTTTAVVVLILVAISKYFRWGAVVNLDLWWLLLVAFGVVFSVRLLLAPYWIYKDKVKEINRLSALVGNKDTPKLPSPPELYLDYLSSKCGIENDVRIITVSAWYRTNSGKMRISQVELHLIGKSIPPLDWRIIEVSQELWYGPDTKFELPIGISSGEHDAELFAFANEELWGPYPFTLSVPEVKP